MSAPDVEAADPFELPEWLGDGEVRWTAISELDGQHLVRGRLEPLSNGAAAAPDGPQQECDLLACDRAYPEPVLDEPSRTLAHQAWALGEEHLVRYDGRLTLVVPGAEMTAELALEAVRRLAKAVGASGERFSVLLRL